MSDDDKAYMVVDEKEDKRWVFTDYENARRANNFGHWRRRALYPMVLEPSLDEIGAGELE